MSVRPKIRVPLTRTDWLLEIVCLLVLSALWLVPTLLFQRLPEQIPVHFNMHGQADRFGTRDNIWTLPAISSMIYLALTALARAPHIFNYPMVITPENAHQQYKLAVRLLRFLKLGTLSLFLFVTIITVSGGVNTYFSETLFLLLTGALIGGPLIYYMIKTTGTHPRK